MLSGADTGGRRQGVVLGTKIFLSPNQCVSLGSFHMCTDAVLVEVQAFGPPTAYHDREAQPATFVIERPRNSDNVSKQCLQGKSFLLTQ